MNRIFLYSHGFATHASDNGLFDEIKTFFPNDEHILFEYDTWTDDINIAATFAERRDTLRAKYSELREANPDAEINLICHSQGCSVAALAQLDGISTTVLLAPNINHGTIEEEFQEFTRNPKATILEDGTISRKRSGGYTTIIKPEYWAACTLLQDLPQKYNQLNNKTRLIIVDSLNDEVIPNHKDYSRLESIRIEHIPTNHGMVGADSERSELKEVLIDIFGE